MELPTVGSADLLRQSTNNNIENVTLLSYNPNKIKQNHQQQNQNYIQRKFVPNQATNNYVVSSSALGSQCKRAEKFNFRGAFRKRSKSASRLPDHESQKNRTSFQGSQSNLLDIISKDEQHQQQSVDHIHRDLSSGGSGSATADSSVKSQDKSQVKLVGFSNNNSEFSCPNLCDSINPQYAGGENNNNNRFTTLRTSREVKMERERLRQEKLHRLTQESKDWFDRMKMESSAAAASANSPRLVSQEETQRFFDETRERLFQTSRLNVLTPTNTLVNNMAGNNINDNDNVDPIGQFVREHQERFAALTASIMGDNNTSTATSATADVVDVNGKSVLRPQRDHVVHSAHAAGLNQSLVRPHPTLTRSDTQPLDGATCQQTSAADLVASILQSSDLSKKHLKKSSSSSKITDQPSSSSGVVRTIEIKREGAIQRSNSGSSCSDSSSGFGSLKNHHHQEGGSIEHQNNTNKTTTNTATSSSVATSKESHPVVVNSGTTTAPSLVVATASPSSSSTTHNHHNLHQHLKLDNPLLNNINPVSKLQLLQERRKLSEHHPSFANHFGFAARYVGQRSDFPGNSSPFNANFNARNNQLQRRIMMNTSTNKVAVTKSKSSSVEYGKDSQSYRFSTEELAMTSYGDSETESDDEEDVDFENLDSVSIVAARASSSSSSTCSNGSNPGQLIRVTSRGHGASPSLDSGRGDSPESSCNSTLVLAPNATPANNSSPKKPPRPISAVPSEYSDVSTSSCRTSDDGDLDETKSTISIVNTNNNNNNSNNINEPVTVSIVVSSTQQPLQHQQIQSKIPVSSSDVVVPVPTSPITDAEQAVSLETRMARVYRVASELLSTEEQYVTVLYLIDQIFHFRVDQENRASNMFSADVLPQIFANIKSIYKFHAEFLLPQLRERMGLWHTDESYQRIGDVIVKFSPFFKMYTEYVKNFDNAIHTINTLYSKNSKFAAIMDDIHAMPECGNLSLQHHMLTPIQRIPRYEILLKEYLKKLPENSQDRADSERALHLVSTAATHANDAMKRIEKFKKLLEVQESLGGTVDLVGPTRELLKEGKIVKISARSCEHQDRYLFLFSDLLLLCSARLITNRVKPTYRLRAKFEVDNMQILEGDNLVTANSFYVRDDHKSVELYTQTKREKEDWLESLFEAIKELYQKKSSLKLGREVLRPPDAEIGKRQPHLLKLDAIHKCMECSQPFSMMRKKYNCRACGVVVCAKCSGQKHPMAFEDNKVLRVCRSCHQVITLRNESESNENKPMMQSKDTMDLPVRPKGLLEIPADTESLQSGYLSLKSGEGLFGGGSKQPQKRWFALLPEFVLYSFKSEDASEALTATPMPGWSVMGGDELKGDTNVSDKEKDKVVKLFYASNLFNNNSNAHPAPARKMYYLVGSSKDEMERWIKVLKLAAKAELPFSDDLTPRSSLQSITD